MLGIILIGSIGVSISYLLNQEVERQKSKVEMYKTMNNVLLKKNSYEIHDVYQMMDEVIIEKEKLKKENEELKKELKACDELLSDAISDIYELKLKMNDENE